MQEKNTIEQMKLIIFEREKRVKELEEELTKFKEKFYSNFNNHNHNNNNPASNETFFLNDTTNHQVKIESNESEFLKARPMSSSRSNTASNNLNRTDSMLEREISASRLNFILYCKLFTTDWYRWFTIDFSRYILYYIIYKLRFTKNIYEI